MVKAEQTVFGGDGRAAGDPGDRAGCAVPAGPFRDGARAARRVPAGRRRAPRRVVRLDAFRISRVRRSRTAQFHGEGDDRPVTYVSRAEAEAFCARGRRAAADARRSGRRRRAAATTGSGRGATSCPTARARSSPRGSAGRCRSARSRGRVAVRRARHGRQRAASGRAATRVRGGSFLSGPDELRCSDRHADAPRRARPLRRLPRRRASIRRRGFDWVDVPAGEYAIGRDGGEHDVVDVDRVRARRARRSRTAQYAAFVAEGGAEPPPHWPAPRRPPGHVRRLVRGVARSAPGRAAGCRPRPSGRRARAAPTAAAIPWGDEEDPSRAAVGAGAEARDDLAGRRAPGRREPLRSAGHGGQRLGVDGERARRRRARAARRLVREPRPRVGALRDAQPQPAARRQAHIGFRVARGEST